MSFVTAEWDNKNECFRISFTFDCGPTPNVIKMALGEDELRETLGVLRRAMVRRKKVKPPRPERK